MDFEAFLADHYSLALDDETDRRTLAAALAAKFGPLLDAAKRVRDAALDGEDVRPLVARSLCPAISELEA
jgi:hypothetical protein